MGKSLNVRVTEALGLAMLPKNPRDAKPSVYIKRTAHQEYWIEFDPEHDNADAFGLLVEHKVSVKWGAGYVLAHNYAGANSENFTDAPAAALRRAICQAVIAAHD